METETALPVTVSARAAKRIAEILKNEPSPSMLRVAVTGGGCSGFQYNFAIDDARMDDDLVVERDGATVLIDPVSLDFLQGRRDRFRRRHDRPGVQDQQPERHLVLRLRNKLLGLKKRHCGSVQT